MKIYFEDGELVSSGYLPIDQYIVVNAGSGVSTNIKVLNNLKEYNPNAVVYTNSIFAFSNIYAWNEELKIPEIYIRAGKHMLFTRIDKLTNRELRSSHNLYKLYAAGEFSDNNNSVNDNSVNDNSVNDNSVIVISQERNGWAWSVDIIMSKLASYTEGGKVFKTPIHKCFKSGFELSYAGACAAAEKCHREYLMSREM